MPENLLPKLLPPDISNVDDYELLFVIEQRYGPGGSSSKDELIYPSSEKHSLKVFFKDGRILSIEPGLAFSVDDLRFLREMVHTQLFESAGSAVGVDILFSSRPIKGSFRSVSDSIQILPAPPEAPRPSVLQADHPFAIEFPVRQSHNGFITNKRRMRGSLEWTWILNALLRANIKYIGPRMQHLWVLCPGEQEDAPSHSRIKWAQEFYMIDKFPPYHDEFTPGSVPGLPQIPHSKYYSSDYWGSDELEIPDTLSSILDLIANLSAEDYRRFIQASQWMYVSNAVWDHHISSSFIAMTIAVESLIDLNAWPKSGPTKRFRGFIERYAPHLDPSEAKKLYKIRSDLAHGWGLLHWDEPAWFFLTGVNELRDRRAIDQLFLAAQQVLINWLWNGSNASLDNNITSK